MLQIGKSIFSSKISHLEGVRAQGVDQAPFPGTHWGEITYVKEMSLETSLLLKVFQQGNILSFVVGLETVKVRDSNNYEDCSNIILRA